MQCFGERVPGEEIPKTWTSYQHLNSIKAAITSATGDRGWTGGFVRKGSLPVQTLEPRLQVASTAAGAV